MRGTILERDAALLELQEKATEDQVSEFCNLSIPIVQVSHARDAAAAANADERFLWKVGAAAVVDHSCAAKAVAPGQRPKDHVRAAVIAVSMVGGAAAGGKTSSLIASSKDTSHLLNTTSGTFLAL